MDDLIQQEIAKAKAWILTIPDGELGPAMKRKFIELSAFMYHAPAEMQHEMIHFLGTTVLQMPLFILGTGQWDREMDHGDLTGLIIDVKAQFSPVIAPALAPIAEKLRATAERLAKAAADSECNGRTQVIYDSDKRPGGKA